MISMITKSRTHARDLHKILLDLAMNRGSTVVISKSTATGTTEFVITHCCIQVYGISMWMTIDMVKDIQCYELLGMLVKFHG